MVFERRRIIILLLVSVILSLATVLSMSDQYYSWDDDYRKGHASDYSYSWWAHAYVGAWHVPSVGYFSFTHKGSGGGTYYSNPNVQFYTKIQAGSSIKDGGYTRALVYMKYEGVSVGPIGCVIAGIGAFAGIKYYLKCKS
ncbi:MAG: hypothetical protein FGF52_00425 [Candidatus Brockarchaeota archaeon]|nr:hypothetical protein [Candidatus Brockarchaeota archaeon]